MKQNKMSKYLKYAIGEILLVVIGILIALGVNQRSQKSDNEAKIEAIFDVVLKDLAADVNECTQIINTVEAIDSMAYLILNDSVKLNSKVHYSDQSIYDQVNLLTFTNLFNFTDGGYQSLSQNLDILPQDYNAILTDLNHQYHTVKESIEYWDNRVNQLTMQNEDFLVNNFNWMHNQRLWRDNIQELREHPKYKNLIHQFIQTNHAWLFHVWRYRTHCISNYQNIAKLLGRSILDDSFKINDAIVQLFIGEWKSSDNPDISNFVYTMEDGRLYIQIQDEGSIKREVFTRLIRSNESTTEIQTVVGREITKHIFKGDNMLLRYNNEYNNGVTEINTIRVK